MVLNTKIYWLTDRQSQCDFDFLTKAVTEFWVLSSRWKIATESSSCEDLLWLEDFIHV
jgi:hypothetical protein